MGSDGHSDWRTICSFWLLYRVFADRGFLLAFVAFLALSFVYKFGVSPMFAVAASVLYFYFKAVGLWREIGIRIALGATRSHVLTQIMKQGLQVTALGVTIGLAGALACKSAQGVPAVWCAADNDYGRGGGRGAQRGGRHSRLLCFPCRCAARR